MTSIHLHTPYLRWLGFMLLITILCYCTPKPASTQQDMRVVAIKRIDSLQIAVKQAVGPNQTQTALRLAEAYQFFALDYPKDSLCVPYILKEANIYASFGDFVKAAQLDKFAYDNYPEHSMRPNALFFLGNNLHDAGDSAQCIVVFDKFVKDYPNHPYQEGAAQMSNFMKQGKGSLDAFIEKRAKQVADSLAKAKPAA